MCLPFMIPKGRLISKGSRRQKPQSFNKGGELPNIAHQRFLDRMMNKEVAIIHRGVGMNKQGSRNE